MRDLLDIKLFSQPFETESNPDLMLENGKLIAQTYANLENCISVLSDMKARKSFLYYGAAADDLGISKRAEEINSIWEDNLLNKVHPDDLQKKYRLEFQFFQLLNTLDPAERINYQLVTKLRIRNRAGKLIMVRHRLLYIGNSDDGSIWLALCLYNILHDYPEFDVPQGAIVNSKTGKIMDHDDDRLDSLLSGREREILQLIKHGHRSKEIADKLMLSINTVNRHRQNIFHKLNVTNAMEACRIAASTGLI